MKCFRLPQTAAARRSRATLAALLLLLQLGARSASSAPTSRAPQADDAPALFRLLQQHEVSAIQLSEDLVVKPGDLPETRPIVIRRNVTILGATVSSDLSLAGAAAVLPAASPPSDPLNVTMLDFNGQAGLLQLVPGVVLRFVGIEIWRGISQLFHILDFMTRSPGSEVQILGSVQHRISCAPFAMRTANLLSLPRPAGQPGPQSISLVSSPPLCWRTVGGAGGAAARRTNAVATAATGPPGASCRTPYMDLHDSSYATQEVEADTGQQGGYIVTYLNSFFVCDWPATPECMEALGVNKCVDMATKAHVGDYESYGATPGGGGPLAVAASSAALPPGNAVAGGGGGPTSRVNPGGASGGGQRPPSLALGLGLGLGGACVVLLSLTILWAAQHRRRRVHQQQSANAKDAAGPSVSERGSARGGGGAGGAVAAVTTAAASAGCADDVETAMRAAAAERGDVSWKSAGKALSSCATSESSPHHPPAVRGSGPASASASDRSTALAARGDDNGTGGGAAAPGLQAVSVEHVAGGAGDGGAGDGGAGDGGAATWGNSTGRATRASPTSGSQALAAGGAEHVMIEMPTGARVDALRRQLAASGLRGRAAVEVGELIGSGSFGRVYRGYWQGITVAVKVLVLPAGPAGAASQGGPAGAGGGGGGPGCGDPALRHHAAVMEAAVSCAVHHRNIVQTYSYSIRPVLDGVAAEPFRCGISGLTAELDAPAAGRQSLGVGGGAGGAVPLPHQHHGYVLQLLLEFCELGSLRGALDSGGFHVMELEAASWAAAAEREGEAIQVEGEEEDGDLDEYLATSSEQHRTAAGSATPAGSSRQRRWPGKAAARGKAGVAVATVHVVTTQTTTTTAVTGNTAAGCSTLLSSIPEPVSDGGRVDTEGSRRVNVKAAGQQGASHGLDEETLWAESGWLTAHGSWRCEPAVLETGGAGEACRSGSGTVGSDGGRTVAAAHGGACGSGGGGGRSAKRQRAGAYPDASSAWDKLGGSSGPSTSGSFALKTMQHYGGVGGGGGGGSASRSDPAAAAGGGGRSLRRRCRYRYGLMLAVAADVASALLHLHSYGIVHGDVKASNVLLTSGNAGRGHSSDSFPAGAAATAAPRPAAEASALAARGAFSGGAEGARPLPALPTAAAAAALRVPDDVVAKLADFGLATHVDERQGTHVSAAVAQGTLTHMAPELMLHGRVSKQCDIYSYGILLYELFTGWRAYDGAARALLPHQVAMGGLRPSFPPHTPPEYRRLAERCWAADPRVRPTFGVIFAEVQRMLAAHMARGAVLAAGPTHGS